MEFVDPFKLDERFLNVLNVVSEERRVPTVRFGSIDVDLLLIAHTNEAEYRRFVSAAETAALQDRFVVVRVPYTVEVSAEEAIYRKLLGRPSQVAISPLAWRVAATWAVLTRLAPARSGLSLVLKSRLYDGEGLPGVPPDTAARERAAAPDEGMNGVGPRYVVNRLSVAVATAPSPCVGPSEVLNALWQGLAENPRVATRDRQSWADLFGAVQEEADRLVQRDVRRAAIEDYPQQRRRLVEDYLTAAALATEAPGERLEARWLHVLTRVEDRLRLSMADRRRMRAALARATDRAACERWLEAAVDAETLPGWPAVAAQITAGRAALERIGSRLVEHLGYDDRCVDSVLARAHELASLRQAGAPGRWLWT
jgi:predicted Ser/Thr protein kinase